ncbi:MAG TPA: rhodanese-like domain-containing protein [Myxococcales bacterium]
MRVTGMAPDKLAWEFGLRRSYVAAAGTTDSLDGPASGVQGLAQSRRGEICAGRNGTRPRTATEMLTGLGFEHVWNMNGGMLDWNVERLPIER